MTRSRKIETAELAFLTARRFARQADGSPLVAASVRRLLKEAHGLFAQAGMTHRAEIVARYAYRLRRRDTSNIVTLNDALLAWRFGGGHDHEEGGDA